MIDILPQKTGTETKMSQHEKEIVLEHLKNSYYAETDDDYSAEFFKSAVAVILSSRKTCEYILDRLSRGKTRGDVFALSLFCIDRMTPYNPSRKIFTEKSRYVAVLFVLQVSAFCVTLVL